MKFLEKLRDFLSQSQQRIISSERNEAIVIKRFVGGAWGIECRDEYQSSGSYIEMMWEGALRTIAFQRQSFKKILVLGAGGGCVIHLLQRLLRSKRMHTEIIAVDWDPMMLQMGMAVYGKNFLQKKNLENLMSFVPSEKKDFYVTENVTLLCDDALHYIQDTKNFFDCIIVDIFNNTQPAQCVYEDAFRDILCTRLSPDGSVLLNCWRSQDGLRAVWEEKFTIEKEIKSCSNNLLYMKPRYAVDQ